TPLVELGLGAQELVLAPLQIRPHPFELLGLRGVGEPVLDRHEPAAFRAERSQPPAEPPLPQRELLLDLVELALADRDRSRTRAQHSLQVFELVAGARPVVTALNSPLRHRASNVHALCEDGSPQYDQARWGGRGSHSQLSPRRSSRPRSPLAEASSRPRSVP